MAVNVRTVKTCFCLSMIFGGIFTVGLLGWMLTPAEQTLNPDSLFPNVIGINGDPDAEVIPVRYDGIKKPPIKLSHVRGLYSYVHFFYHTRFEKHPMFENRANARVWECAFWCDPVIQGDPSSRLYLVYYENLDESGKKPKKLKNFYLMELRDGDEETPVVYGRTKHRKKVSLEAPWVEPDQEREKPRDLPIYMVTAWDLFKFDDPIKICVGVAVVLLTAIGLWMLKKGNDDDD